MPRTTETRPSTDRGPGRARWLTGVVALVVAVTAMTGLALAASSTVSATKNSKLGKTIYVDSHGMTLYTLSGETSKKLKCSSSSCLAIWTPLYVSSSKVTAGKGVSGKLSTFKRSNRKLQVTLNSKPLYRFSSDTKKGDAGGQGIKSFGGTWSTVSGSSAKSPTKPSSPTPTSGGGYGY